MRARIGVIGAGWWAVVNHLPVLTAMDDCQVVAVNRLGAVELATVQQTFGVPRGYEDADAMLASETIEGVVIASPHVLHHAHALAALAHGCHVLVEKPLATSAADARAILAAAEAAKRQIVMPCGWNFAPWTARARELVAAGAIGAIRHVVLQMASPLADLFAGEPMAETATHLFRPPPSTWADPSRAGGYGWGQLVHALSLLFGITDLQPESVFALTGHSGAGVDYYDTASVRFAGGATGAISGAATVPKHRGFQLDLRLFGTEGMLLIDVERARLELRRHDGRDTLLPLTEADTAYSCEAPLRVLVDLCLGRATRNPAPGDVGVRAVEVLDAMYRSAASGRMESV